MSPEFGRKEFQSTGGELLPKCQSWLSSNQSPGGSFPPPCLPLPISSGLPVGAALEGRDKRLSELKASPVALSPFLMPHSCSRELVPPISPVRTSSTTSDTSTVGAAAAAPRWGALCPRSPSGADVGGLMRAIDATPRRRRQGKPPMPRASSLGAGRRVGVLPGALDATTLPRRGGPAALAGRGMSGSPSRGFGRGSVEESGSAGGRLAATSCDGAARARAFDRDGWKATETNACRLLVASRRRSQAF